MNLPSPDEVLTELAKDHGFTAKTILADRKRVVEACARICVRRSCTWSESDDERSQDFREGIEVAASQLACAIRSLDIGAKNGPPSS